MLDIYKKYVGKVGKAILKDYKSPQKYVLFNEDDPKLTTIPYQLPEPPPLDEIDGFGLPVKKQMWKPPKLPLRLKQLENSCETIDEIYERIYRNPNEFREEIKWIKQEWERRLKGYWLYINGVPTFMDGWHYFYCGYWHLDSGLPEYRYRDYIFFHFARFCWTDTKLPDGTDLHRRLCYGFNWPKHRREGATYKGASINYEIVSRTKSVHGGIQSMDGPSAKKTFLEKYVQPWKKLPFFFKPKYTNSTSPKSGFGFDIPSTNIGSKGSLAKIKCGLESKITYAESAKRDFYDGDKLICLHDDETGKTRLENVFERHMVLKKCLAQSSGRKIHGLTIKTSTVGEMDDMGGRNFYDLCKNSMWDERNENGETVTGLYNCFVPAYVCLDDFIDIFGNPIIENPTESDLWRIPEPTYNSRGELIGAKQYIENARDAYLLQDDEKGQKNYEEETRLAPTSFDECFISANSNSGLPLQKIVRRLKQLQFLSNDEIGVRRGNFKWKNNKPDTEVIWVDDPNGRWVVSLLLPDNVANKKFKGKILDVNTIIQTWKPTKPNVFVGCADPFQFLKNQKDGKRLSKGGGAIFWNRDYSIDPEGKPIEEWESYRTVCTYLYRVEDPDDYAEDMLMMSVYYGAMMYPEINVDLIWKHFRRRGYLGFLLHKKDVNGKIKPNPGFFAKGPVQQELFAAHKQWLEHNWMREKHVDILEQCKDIKGIEDLTNFDLFVAVGGAYLGAETEVMTFGNPDMVKKVKVSDFMVVRNY